MQFWFCETCGKRVTDQDLADGSAHDKKAKGVFCKTCGVGVSTMYFEAIDASEVEKGNVKPSGHALAPSPVRDSSSTLHPRSGQKSRSRISAAVSGRASDHGRKTGILAGVSAAIGVLVLTWSVASVQKKPDMHPALQPVPVRVQPAGSVARADEKISSSSGPLPTVAQPTQSMLPDRPSSDSPRPMISRPPQLPQSVNPNSKSTVIPPTNIKDGLVAWWKLDETSGNTAADSSGHGHTGTVVNGPVWSAGRVGGGLTFETTGGYVDLGLVPKDGDLSLSQSDSTICAWIKPSARSQPYARILDKSDGAYAHNGFAVVLDGTSLQLYVNGTYCSSSVKLGMESWSHVAVILSNSGYKLFINGHQDNGATTSGGPAQRPPNVDAPLKLGTWNVPGDRAFKGLLDDVRIYNRALSDTELKELASGK